MNEIILEIMNEYGYIGIFLLIFLENIFPPIPSEVILLFGGFMTTYTHLNILLMSIISALASVLGAIVLYKLGRIFNIERITKILSSKIGKYLFIKISDVNKYVKWFKDKGEKTIFFCRFIPVVRSLISIPAGMSKMSILKFLIYTTLGSFIWNFIIILLGAIFGENWNSILVILNTYSSLILFLLLIFGLLIISLFYKKNNHNML